MHYSKTIKLLVIIVLFGSMPSAHAMNEGSGESSWLPSWKTLLLTSSVVVAGVALQKKKASNRRAREQYRQEGMQLVDDIKLLHDESDSKSRHDKMVTIFLHGQGGDANHGNYYHASNGGPIEGPLMVCNFRDVHEGFLTTDLGQDDNIRTALAMLRKARQLGFGKICFAGESRGAATVVNTAGSEEGRKIFDEMGKNICIVAISPFAKLQDAARNAAGPLSSLTHYLPESSINGSLEVALPHHDLHGIQPEKSVTNISPQAATLYICSGEDRLIPAASTEAVAFKQKKAGHSGVHMLNLQHGGGHAQIVYGQQGKLVGDVWHAFLNKYEFPANRARATLGTTTLEEGRLAQLSIEHKERKS